MSPTFIRRSFGKKAYSVAGNVCTIFPRFPWTFTLCTVFPCGKLLFLISKACDLLKIFKKESPSGVMTYFGFQD